MLFKKILSIGLTGVLSAAYLPTNIQPTQTKTANNLIAHAVDLNENNEIENKKTYTCEGCGKQLTEDEVCMTQLGMTLCSSCRVRGMGGTLPPSAHYKQNAYFTDTVKAIDDNSITFTKNGKYYFSYAFEELEDIKKGDNIEINFDYEFNAFKKIYQVNSVVLKNSAPTQPVTSTAITAPYGSTTITSCVTSVAHTPYKKTITGYFERLDGDVICLDDGSRYPFNKYSISSSALAAINSMEEGDYVAIYCTITEGYSALITSIEDIDVTPAASITKTTPIVSTTKIKTTTVTTPYNQEREAAGAFDHADNKKLYFVNSEGYEYDPKIASIVNMLSKYSVIKVTFSPDDIITDIEIITLGTTGTTYGGPITTTTTFTTPYNQEREAAGAFDHADDTKLYFVNNEGYKYDPKLASVVKSLVKGNIINITISPENIVTKVEIISAGTTTINIYTSIATTYTSIATTYSYPDTNHCIPTTTTEEPEIWMYGTGVDHFDNIRTLPTKTIYNEGEDLDLSGLVISAHHSVTRHSNKGNSDVLRTDYVWNVTNIYPKYIKIESLDGKTSVPAEEFNKLKSGAYIVKIGTDGTFKCKVTEDTYDRTVYDTNYNEFSIMVYINSAAKSAKLVKINNAEVSYFDIGSENGFIVNDIGTYTINDISSMLGGSSAESDLRKGDTVSGNIYVDPDTNTIIRGELEVSSYAGKRGDANADSNMDMADVVIVMQSLANPDKYGLNGSDEHHITKRGTYLSDINGGGLTVQDAQLIQRRLLGLDKDTNENEQPISTTITTAIKTTATTTVRAEETSTTTEGPLTHPTYNFKEVVSYPTKTVYKQGEKFELDGIEFIGTRINGDDEHTYNSKSGIPAHYETTPTQITFTDKNGKVYSLGEKRITSFDAFQELPAGEYTVHITGDAGSYYSYNLCHGLDITYKITIV